MPDDKTNFDPRLVEAVARALLQAELGPGAVYESTDVERKKPEAVGAIIAFKIISDWYQSGRGDQLS